MCLSARKLARQMANAHASARGPRLSDGGKSLIDGARRATRAPLAVVGASTWPLQKNAKCEKSSAEFLLHGTGRGGKDVLREVAKVTTMYIYDVFSRYNEVGQHSDDQEARSYAPFVPWMRPPSAARRRFGRQS